MRKHADSARLRRLSLHHDCFMKDMMHKVSTDIVRYCVEHKVGTNRHGSEPGLEAGGRPETPQEETPTTPKTGDDRNPLIWLLLLGLGGGLAGTAWYLKKKDEKDQNQE